jgi:hypothetical protein
MEAPRRQAWWLTHGGGSPARHAGWPFGRVRRLLTRAVRRGLSARGLLTYKNVSHTSGAGMNRRRARMRGLPAALPARQAGCPSGRVRRSRQGEFRRRLRGIFMAVSGRYC